MQRLLVVLTLLLACGPALAQPRIHTEKVAYREGGVQLHGFLAYNTGIQGKRPGVLVVHEWWGLNDYVRDRCKQLARRGYIAFAADMYGEGKVTKHAKEAGAWAKQIRANVKGWQQRAFAGLEKLRDHKLVDRERIAAIGYCFGGATVLQLAYSGSPIAGVVSFHGSLPLPEKGATGVVKAKILICHGAQDSFVPKDHIPKFQESLDKVGADWHMVSYARARHGFTNPGADKHGIAGLKYDRVADKRSWAHMRGFFLEIFD